MKKVVILSAAALIIIGCGHGRQELAQKETAESEVLREQVGESTAIMVINTRNEGAFWFLLINNGADHFLGNGLSELYEVYQLQASLDEKYLAVLSVGEGHPILEIWDLPTLVNDYQRLSLFSINPYPGSIMIEKWEPDVLIVESDMLLTVRDADDYDRTPPCLIFDKTQKFSIHAGDWKIQARSPEARSPEHYFEDKFKAQADDRECVERALQMLRAGQPEEE